MTFIHVIPTNVFVTERSEHPHAAHSEDRLLAKAITGVSAVKRVSQRAVKLIVFRKIGIQQNDRNLTASDALDCVLPRAQLNSAALNKQIRLWREFLTEPFDSPFGRRLNLPAIRIEALVEIALSVQKR